MPRSQMRVFVRSFDLSSLWFPRNPRRALQDTALWNDIRFSARDELRSHLLSILYRNRILLSTACLHPDCRVRIVFISP